MITPAEHNIDIYQNREFQKDFVFYQSNGTDLYDISDITFKAEIRTKQSQSGQLIAIFNVTKVDATSTVTMKLTSEQTKCFSQTKLYWDLLGSTADEDDQSYVYGTVLYTNTVTEV